MAIIVPSKKLYDTQSPQILKNAVKGITINLLKDELVYSADNNNAFDYVINIAEPEKSDDHTWGSSITHPTDVNGRSAMLLAAMGYQTKEISGRVGIAKKGDGYYIAGIDPTLNLEINFSQGPTQIKVLRKKGKEDASVTFLGEGVEFEVQKKGVITNYNYSDSFLNRFDFDIGTKNQVYANIESNINILTQKSKESPTIKVSAPFNFELSYFTNLDGTETSPLINLKIFDEIKFGGERSQNFGFSQDENYFWFTYSFVKELLVDLFSDVYYEITENQEEKEVYDGATRYLFEVTKATIVLNETIRKIDRSKETDSVANVDSEGNPEQRGVQLSVGDNQFIKSGTTYDGGNANVPLWGNVAYQYDGGKPYVRFVCSVGEYYDNEGNKVISTDTSDKMGFDIYDQVVVMKSGKHNADESIMLNSNGESKIYSVVSVKTYFDGALWQEVVAIDTRKTVDLRKTTYTTFINKAGGFTYKITSNQIRTEQNSAQGTTYIIGE